MPLTSKNIKYNLLLFFMAACLTVFSSQNHSNTNASISLESDINSVFERVVLLDESQEFEKAEQVCDSLLLSLSKAPKTASEHDAIIQIFVYKAIYLQEKSKLSQANVFFEKALNSFEKSTKKHQDYLYFIYPKLGNNYTRLGDNEKAILIHLKMIALAKKNNSYEELVQSYLNLSIVYENINQLEKAIETSKKSFVLLEEVSVYRKAKLYSNYANFMYLNKQNDEAIVYLDKAENILRNIDSDTYYLGGVYNTYAYVAIAKQQKNKAKHYFKKAIKAYQYSKQNRSRNIAKNYIEMLDLYARDIQEYYLDSALYALSNKSDFTQLNSTDLYAENTFVELFDKKIDLIQTDTDKLILYDYLFEVQTLLRQEYLFEQSKLDILKQENQWVAAAVGVCYNAYDKTKNAYFVFKAMEYIENSKSRLLLESLIENVDQYQKENYSYFISKKKKLNDALILAQRNQDKESIRSLEIKLKEHRFDYDLRLSEFNKLIKDKQFHPFSSIDFIKNYLAKDQAILSFFDTDSSIYAVYFDHDTVQFMQIHNTKALQQKLYDFSRFFSFENRFSFDINLAEELSVIFIKSLKINKKRLVILSDGVLRNIPFDAFVLDDKYLLEHFEIHYAFSAQILQAVSSQNSNNKQVVAYAPLFKNKPSMYLKKSTQEMNLVTSYFKGKIFMGNQANSSNFLENAKEFALIHISTHAKIDSLLNKACIDFYDKSLYFSQIKDETFEADLMVLSACETNIGKTEIGEGSMSLSRAFAYANIKGIVSSLWQVNEESTLHIFDVFYRNIAQNKSISTSLHQAKIDYLKNPNIAEEMKTPYYWAAFIFVGKDLVLDIETKSNSIYFYCGLAFLCIIITFLIVKFKIKKRHN